MTVTLTAGEQRQLNIALVPIQNVGCLQGYVLNKTTGAKIPMGKALITIDGTQSFYNIVDELGGYRTPNLPYGAHHFSVEVDNYQTGEFDLGISQPVSNYNFKLAPMPVAPTEWTPGVEVTKIEVTPSVAYVGETVKIGVDIQYPYPLELPAEIYGSVLVNGQKLTGSWTIDYRNPTLYLNYTATQVGVFTVRAQDKSTTFEVLPPSPVGQYYSPWGGIRMPTPDEWHTESGEVFKFKCGMEALAQEPPEFVFVIGFAVFDGYRTVNINGYATWNPPGTIVTTWKAHQIGTLLQPMPETGVRVVPLAWTGCPKYWESKEELAKALAGEDIAACYDANGDPTAIWSLMVYSLGRNLAFWVKRMVWKGEADALILECPYCRSGVQGPGRLVVMRDMLEHIELEHPDHPLTAPAWF